MNQRRTIVNTALSNRPAGTVVMVAALLGGLYYLYCLLRVPGAESAQSCMRFHTRVMRRLRGLRRVYGYAACRWRLCCISARFLSA